MAGSTNIGFFAVSRSTFIKACDLGINPACAYLVMACGTGRDQSTTKWSATAVAKWVGVRWSTANAAIEALIKAGLAVQNSGRKRTHPSYKLKTDNDLIWLPRTIIEGASDETPPVARLRQAQDVMTLRLFIEMYSAQNLVEDGGISAKVIYQTYIRRKVGEQGPYAVWGFKLETSVVAWGDVTRPHRRAELTPEEVAANTNASVDFFPRLDRIVSLGLIEWTPYLFESKTGEPIHAMAENGLPAEEALYWAAVSAAESMLTEGQMKHLQGTCEIPVPVLRHIDRVEMIGIARLRYRPQTTLTAAWLATHKDSCNAFTETYAELLKPKTASNDQANRKNMASSRDFDNVPF